MERKGRNILLIMILFECNVTYIKTLFGWQLHNDFNQYEEWWAKRRWWRDYFTRLGKGILLLSRENIYKKCATEFPSFSEQKIPRRPEEEFHNCYDQEAKSWLVENTLTIKMNVKRKIETFKNSDSFPFQQLLFYMISDCTMYRNHHWSLKFLLSSFHSGRTGQGRVERKNKSERRRNPENFPMP